MIEAVHIGYFLAYIFLKNLLHTTLTTAHHWGPIITLTYYVHWVEWMTLKFSKYGSCYASSIDCLHFSDHTISAIYRTFRRWSGMFFQTTPSVLFIVTFQRWPGMFFQTTPSVLFLTLQRWCGLLSRLCGASRALLSSRTVCSIGDITESANLAHILGCNLGKAGRHPIFLIADGR